MMDSDYGLRAWSAAWGHSGASWLRATDASAIWCPGASRRRRAPQQPCTFPAKLQFVKPCRFDIGWVFHISLMQARPGQERTRRVMGVVEIRLVGELTLETSF